MSRVLYFFFGPSAHKSHKCCNVISLSLLKSFRGKKDNNATDDNEEDKREETEEREILIKNCKMNLIPSILLCCYFVTILRYDAT